MSNSIKKVTFVPLFLWKLKERNEFYPKILLTALLAGANITKKGTNITS